MRAMRNEFVHLHLHSQYSLLDAMNRFDELAKAVKKRGMRAVALTDHGNMFGAIDFYRTTYGQGVKPIIGCEVYVAPGSRFEKEKRPDGFERGFHLTLLAASADGYRNLVKLSSLAFTEGFYYHARIDHELLDAHAEGIIALSGCLSSESAKKFLAGNVRAAEEALGRYREIFGAKNFFVELQDHGLDAQREYMKFLIDSSKKDRISTVATNDVHYLDRSDAAYHDALLCVGTRSLVTDIDRKKYGSDQFYLKTPDEMARVFGFDPDAVRRTVEIADSVDLDLDFSRHHLPSFPIPVGERSEGEYLEKLAEEGLAARVKNPTEEYRARLRHELDVITKKGFAGYFLIVADFMNEARRRGIPVGPGRGSSAGSLVAFVLGITEVDPLVYGLIFERFLNPERTALPDIDVDICQLRRDEIIAYVKERYGADRVAQIITFGTFGAKAVLRDVARIRNLDLAETERLVRLVPDQLRVTLADAIEKVADLKTEAGSSQKELFETALALEGLVRHASRHAAGVVIANVPITEVAPLYRDSDGHVVTQYDMNAVDALGLLKMDILGLKTLSVVARAEVYAREEGGSPVGSFADLDFSDTRVYDFLATGHTLGVFQLDSSGIRDLILKVQPTCFEDLAAVIALYRPGPMNLADDFVARKHGRQAVEFAHKSLEKVLGPTYGVILYQEQVMSIAHTMGSFSLAEADNLRKAMGKKNPELMASYREKFVTGSAKNGVGREIAEPLFDQMERFAGYGFNRSHAVAYAFIAFKTAWLKVYHPRAFMAAALSFEYDNHDKLSVYAEETRRMGIELMPPSIETPLIWFAPNPEDSLSIRYGLAAVKNVGVSACEAIMEASADARFESLRDFLLRIDRKRVGKRAIEALCYSGAFDHFGSNRRSMIEALPSLLSGAEADIRERETGQMNLFGEQEVRPRIIELDEFEDRASLEREHLGFFLSEHPLTKRFPSARLLKRAENSDGKRSWVVGMIEGVAPALDKRGVEMARAKAELIDSRCQLILFASSYRKHKEKVTDGAVVLARGRFQGPDSMIVDEIEPVEKVSWKARVKLVNGGEEELRHLEKEISSIGPGRCEIEIEVPRKGGTAKALLVRSRRSVDVTELARRVEKLTSVSISIEPR